MEKKSWLSILRELYYVYISVIQKNSFLSPPITQSGSVLCQLSPAPTGADPIITG